MNNALWWQDRECSLALARQYNREAASRLEEDRQAEIDNLAKVLREVRQGRQLPQDGLFSTELSVRPRSWERTGQLWRGLQ